MGDQHPPHGARNRVQVRQCLIGEARERKHQLRKTAAERERHGSEMLAAPDIFRLSEQVRNRGNYSWNQDDCDCRKRP